MRKRGGALLLLIAVALRAEAQRLPPREIQPDDDYHLIFASSFLSGIDIDQSVPPNFPEFGGLEAADWNVTYGAFNAGLVPGWNGSDVLWKAVLSTEAVDARDRFTLIGPLFNTHGEKVGDNQADLWDGSVDAPVGYDEYGSSITSNTLVWTGTNAIGRWTIKNCYDWKSLLGDGQGGQTNRSDTDWIDAMLEDCTETARLYGVSPAITMTAISPTSSATLGPRPSSDLAPTGGSELAVNFEFQTQQVTFSTCCGGWFDPEITEEGMLFESADGSLFTEISNFSDDLLGPVTVWADDQNLGEFSAGDELDFLALVGHGVDSFAVTGIELPFGATGVPFYLLFDTAGAEFTVQPLTAAQAAAVPEASSAWLVLIGALTLWVCLRNERNIQK